MARVSRSAVEDRLARMAREIDAIEVLRPASLPEYVAEENETVRMALEHRVFLATQAMVDIAAHIVASRGYGVPGTYREAVVQLGAIGVVPQGVAAAVADAAGLRNAIAHAYLNLDQERVFTALWKTDDLKRFAAAVWEWLEREG